jgi:hypothetical protein
MIKSVFNLHLHCITSASGDKPHRMLKVFHILSNIAVAIFKVNIFIGGGGLEALTHICQWKCVK